MNIKITVTQGGIFSQIIKILQTIINYLVNNNLSPNDIDNIYIIETSGNINQYDFIFNQNPNLVFNVTLVAKSFFSYKNITEHIHYEKYLKIIFSKLNFKKTILEKVNSNVNENTLGVHIRLTDMNKIHPEQGFRSFQTYFDAINNYNKKSINNIFIASDNIQSINKIKNYYPNVIINNVNNRAITETGPNYFAYQKNNWYSEEFWVDTFIDTITLSKCGHIIKGASNLSNVALIMNNNLKNIIYV